MLTIALLTGTFLGCRPEEGGDRSDGPPTDGGADGDVDADADADADADTDADVDADTDGDTGTPVGYARPTSLTVTCDPTPNALRFLCEVAVEPAQPVTLRWSRVDALGPTRTRTGDAAVGQHEIPLIYLAPLLEYRVEAYATAWPDDPIADTTVTAGAPPAGVRSRLLMTGASTLGLIGTEAPCSVDAIAVIYDTSTGDVVWYHDLDPQGTLGVLDMVRFTDEQTVLGETDHRIVEVDLMGNDLVRFSAVYEGCCGLNHEVVKHDGLYWSQYQHQITPGFGGLIVDDIVALDANGVEQLVWHADDHLDLPAGADGDFLHTNSEDLDANGDLYLSWLSQDALAKIEGDPAAPNWGEPIWILTGDGRDGELGNDITLDWSAVPLPHDFGGQHNLHLRHDGRLMFLDNDNGRGLVITVDDATLTGTVDAAYRTRENRCGFQGTAMDSQSGNAVVGCTGRYVREYDLASGDLIWEAEVDCPNGGGGGWSPNAAVRWYPLDGWE